MKMKPFVSGTCRQCRNRFAGMAMAIVLLAAGSGVRSEENDAFSILRAMSDHLSAQSSIELSFDSDIEVITPELEKIQFTSSGKALLVRPNKLRAHRVGGYSDVELFFDGKTVSVYGKHVEGYAQFSGPTTVDMLIEALRAGHGVSLPGADLLVSRSYETLTADVLEAKHIGRGVVGGRVCEHLAFRNFDTDWQLWVEAGDSPVPCKLVITSKTLNSAPQYTLRITEWEAGVTPAPDAFTFTPPEGARILDPHALIDLDELPEGTSPGERQ